jgi:heptosyltransferase-1
LPQPPQRILLVRLSHLGDVVHALPVYHALRRAFPRAALGWAVQREFSELVAGLPGIDRVLRFDRQGGLGAWIQLRRELRAFAPDWAVDAQGNLKSAAVTLLSGARRRSGWHASLWTEAMGAWVLDDPSPRFEQSSVQHAVSRSLHLARHVAPELSSEELLQDPVALNGAELARGRARWEEHFGSDQDEQERPPIIVQLAARGDVRAWPVDHQVELLRRLEQEGRRVLALSGPGEALLGERLAARLGSSPNLRHWVGQRGLRELAAFFRVAGERGARLVSCDSGPLHLAAACDLPVLCLAGPQDARLTGPFPPPGAPSPHVVLRSTVPLFCAPCRHRSCSRASEAPCMTTISPDAVLQALRVRTPEGVRPVATAAPPVHR